MVIQLNNNFGVEHHMDEKRKRLYTLLFVLLGVFVLVGLYFIFQNNFSNYFNEKKDEGLTDAEKMQLLSELRNESATSTVSEKDQRILLKSLNTKATSSPPGGGTSGNAALLQGLKN